LTRLPDRDSQVISVQIGRLLIEEMKRSPYQPSIRDQRSSIVCKRHQSSDEESAVATGTREQPATVTREQLIERLNEDLSREYQAIIAYVVYSQVLKGAEYMNIAAELKKHAGEELQHALTVAKHIDYLGGMPTVSAQPVKQSDDAREMLRADLENENATVRAYRERVQQCEALGEYAIGEDIREILRQEQEHQIDLATALGEDVPDLRK
jgi:bacterioferritin